MNLQTRPVVLATAALASLAAGVIIWQLAKSPSTTPGKTTTTSLGSASGLVTQAPEATRLAAPEAPPSALAAASSAAPMAAVIQHRVIAPKAAAPPILPNEVNAAITQALGSKRSLLRLFYLDPLARRFVASVDGLGNKPAPNELWLLKPAPGAIKLVTSSRQPGTQLIQRANSQRYARFMQWVAQTDNAKLLGLYARMYPLLQQTYVDLGHPNGYFNDRVISVIDLMLATPDAKPPLRVQPASAAKLPSKRSATGPQPPSYEFSDPGLESLATGQKLLLRIGPQNAAPLKLKLKALRSGLIRLGEQPRQD